MVLSPAVLCVSFAMFFEWVMHQVSIAQVGDRVTVVIVVARVREATLRFWNVQHAQVRHTTISLNLAHHHTLIFYTERVAIARPASATPHHPSGVSSNWHHSFIVRCVAVSAKVHESDRWARKDLIKMKPCVPNLEACILQIIGRIMRHNNQLRARLLGLLHSSPQKLNRLHTTVVHRLLTFFHFATQLIIAVVWMSVFAIAPGSSTSDPCALYVRVQIVQIERHNLKASSLPHPRQRYLLVIINGRQVPTLSAFLCTIAVLLHLSTMPPL
mmetsp:Transcript_21131/g.34869  ORF Transcript_21131/g.34869 Transcript_21131/m.34869 type:complete len:271 (-) Transcript_21131:178-990(-)